MALINAYLMTTKNLEGVLAAIRNAQAPEKFTIKFLESLGYTSTNDRLIIGVLIYFTEIKDLTAIIQQNWSSFEALLQDMDWVRHLLRTVERSRNVIMHSGQLALDDIERVGISIRDWIRQAGG